MLAYLRFVVKVAHRYANRGIELADLVQEGSKVLLKAVDRYQPESAIPFCSYLEWRLRGAFHKLVVGQPEATASLDVEMEDSGEDTALTLADSMADGDELPDDVACRHDLEERVRAAVRSLPEGERVVIGRRYWAEETLTEVAKATGPAVSEPRRREKRALQHLAAMAPIYDYANAPARGEEPEPDCAHCRWGGANQRACKRSGYSIGSKKAKKHCSFEAIEGAT